MLWILLLVINEIYSTIFNLIQYFYYFLLNIPIDQYNNTHTHQYIQVFYRLHLVIDIFFTNCWCLFHSITWPRLQHYPRFHFYSWVFSLNFNFIFFLFILSFFNVCKISSGHSIDGIDGDILKYRPATNLLEKIRTRTERWNRYI